ncbi:glycosyltransferase family 2 protein [Solihabitans fulvus]|uniref:4,4'-diaponeurosporenoate glycosyltransferase n=1 Tax=Solihabitans fulvus TaxID=1892852 RepID=A0A5B2XCX6_9PSEU|nr:glycosyltransferase family A protein [Solihabitans fulvus]KAA2261183.1 glycosyltransferase family 2 protein [Solihabitans fulvus]
MEVVVPAHNEESTLGGCLDGLASAGSVSRVVVVPNGCVDRTEGVALAHRSRPTVRRSPTPGKAAALNLGDAECAGFPRAYLDADIVLDGAALDALAAAASAEDTLVAVPVVRLDLTDASWLVRRYYGAQRALPTVRDDPAGRGVYVLGRRAHERVFPLPDNLIADDGYVARAVGSTGCVVVPAAVVVLVPAGTLPALLRRRLRVQAGNQQLDALLPAESAAESRVLAGGAGLLALSALVRSGRVRPIDAVVFTGVTTLTRLLVLVRRWRGREVRWGSTR